MTLNSCSRSSFVTVKKLASFQVTCHLIKPKAKSNKTLHGYIVTFYRRKRLVNSLMSKTPCPDTVDELKRVEDEIEKIRKKIQKKEGIVN